MKLKGRRKQQLVEDRVEDIHTVENEIIVPDRSTASGTIF
jgi:hypothetical protein